MESGIGKRGVGIALGVTVLVPLVLSLVFFPVANMQLKGLPFGVLSLDAGAQTPAGETNLGDTMVEKMQSGDLAELMAVSEESAEETDTAEPSALADAFAFDVYDSQEALDAAFDDGKLYGAIVIPDDFSELQVKAMMAKQQVAAGSTATETNAESPTLDVVIDYAKSPMVASQMQTGMASMLGGSDAPFDINIEMINMGPAADASGSNNMLGGVFSQVMVLMPLLACSLVAGALAVMGLKVRGRKTPAERAKAYGTALAIDAVAAVLLALMLFWVATCVAGIPAGFGPFFGYTWCAAFLLMVFFGGLACVRGRVAAVGGALIILLGITSGYLPIEGLPAFWQDWIAPWAPEPYLGEGLRSVMYAGGDIWNAGTICLSIYAVVGLCFAALGISMGDKLVKGRSATKG